MRLIKGLLAAAITAALLVLPAGALAKSRDRDHDRMPDKWEKRHHLNVRANDARKDPDHDHLSNLAEFQRQTDPRDADTDDDGIDDENEVAGTVVSFANNVLTIQLRGTGAGTVSGTVTDATEIECESDNEDDDTPTASASHDGSDDNSGTGSQSNGGDDEGDNEDGGSCSTTSLTQGAVVREAEFGTATDGSTVFKEIKFEPAA
ncbi:MAG TPA: hypothetical protein VE570_08730 [Thermoleophilaceae bacterium]|jgi:hypothetical protein|nr:hypothetical protein [Thermoleophilaceae bacterium]